MQISMYAASAPQFINALRNLSSIIDKAAAHVDSRKLDPAALLTARLFPDMFPFTRQVQIACDNAISAVARLATIEVPTHENNEQSFEALKTRIAKTIAFIETVTPSQVDGSEGRDISLKFGSQEINWTGTRYLLGFIVPNFYFHVTTAYAILRHNGVELGKRDYIAGQ